MFKNKFGKAIATAAVSLALVATPVATASANTLESPAAPQTSTTLVGATSGAVASGTVAEYGSDCYRGYSFEQHWWGSTSKTYVSRQYLQPNTWRHTVFVTHFHKGGSIPDYYYIYPICNYAF